MYPRWLFSEEDEVRKKKTLVLLLAFLLIPALLGLYAVTGPEGGLIGRVTPTALPSPGAVAATTAPGPTVAPTSVALGPTFTPTVTSLVPTLVVPLTPSEGVTPVAKATAAPLSTPAPVPSKPTATPTTVPVALAPTTAPTVVPIAPLAAPAITTPQDGSVLKDGRPTISGTAPPHATVQVYDDGALLGTATAGAQGDWTLLPGEPLGSGEHTVTAVASDEAGRTSDPSAAVTFTVAIERLPVVGGSWFERGLDRLFMALP